MKKFKTETHKIFFKERLYLVIYVAVCTPFVWHALTVGNTLDIITFVMRLGCVAMYLLFLVYRLLKLIYMVAPDVLPRNFHFNVPTFKDAKDN